MNAFTVLAAGARGQAAYHRKFVRTLDVSPTQHTKTQRAAKKAVVGAKRKARKSSAYSSDDECVAGDSTTEEEDALSEEVCISDSE